MVTERKGLLSLGGREVTILGPDLNVGEVAPDFEATTQSWETINFFGDYSNKVKIIAAVPSLETSVCDRETRSFNQAASDLSEDIVIITISTDLPYTQARWCGGAGIDRVVVVSDHQNTDFGLKYGCLVKERRILRRAVFVINRGGEAVYSAYMKTLGEEPDYEAVLQAAKEAV